MFFCLSDVCGRSLRRVSISVLAATVLTLSACVSNVTVEEPQANHPASPEAQATPLPPESKALAIDAQPVPKPAPKPAAGGHDHHKHH